MKVLTAAEMRDVDRATEAAGIPGAILMENAGHRVVEYMVERWSPLSKHRIVILCGKGNNGGDGYVVARQLLTRFRLRALDVVTIDPAEDSAPRRMLEAAGGRVGNEITQAMRYATLVVDALLGTGVSGAARGRALELIREINTGFTSAEVLAVDVPSGMNSDSGQSSGEVARATATVTFTAPKLCHALSPNCDRLGELRVGNIGTAAKLLEHVKLHVSEPGDFRHLLDPRERDSNKGTYGHVLIVGGAEGKTGAAEMAGLAALRAGAGLVTVASSASRFTAPELMTTDLPSKFDELSASVDKKNVVGMGPGLGTSEEHVSLTRDAVESLEQAMVVDADGLNALAGFEWSGEGKVRVLTPHPGEMSRLCGLAIAEVQSRRLEVARSFASDHACTIVLKGYRTIIAFSDGRCYVNPTGTPALAKGGTGDVLAGLLAGLLAQYPNDPEKAVIAGVYLHGLAAQKGEALWGERSLFATDLLTFLPEAMRECTRVSDVF